MQSAAFPSPVSDMNKITVEATHSQHAIVANGIRNDTKQTRNSVHYDDT